MQCKLIYGKCYIYHFIWDIYVFDILHHRKRQACFIVHKISKISFFILSTLNCLTYILNSRIVERNVKINLECIQMKHLKQINSKISAVRRNFIVYIWEAKDVPILIHLISFPLHLFKGILLKYLNFPYSLQISCYP